MHNSTEPQSVAMEYTLHHDITNIDSPTQTRLGTTLHDSNITAATTQPGPDAPNNAEGSAIKPRPDSNIDLPHTTSPLTLRYAVWDKELHELHTHMCTCPGTCTGIRLGENLPTATQCVPAKELSELLTGLQPGSGFMSIAPGEEPLPKATTVYPLSDTEHEAICADVEKRVRQGHLVELQERPPRAAPLFAKQEADKIRTIWNYSDGDGAFNTLSDHERFTMMGITEACQYIDNGYVWMGKVDASDAYFQVPLHPTQWRAAACSAGKPGRVKYFIPTRLCFGMARAPETFCRISAAIRMMLHRRGIQAIVVYVDDFLVLGRTKEECQEAMTCLVELLESLGFEVNKKPHKLVGPSLRLVFLGYDINTDVRSGNAMDGGIEIRIPQDKLDKARQALEDISKPGAVYSKKRLNECLGLLNFIARAVFGIKPFTASLRNALNTGTLQDPQIQRDCKAICHFLATYSGYNFLHKKVCVHTEYFATDASLKIGMGGFFNKHYFAITWEQLHQSLADMPRAILPQRLWPLEHEGGRYHIAYLELFAAFWGLYLWRDDFANRWVQIHVDNSNAAAWLTTGTGPPGSAIALILRHLFAMLAKHGIRLVVTLVESKRNPLADALSRQDWDAFRLHLRLWEQSHITSDPFAIAEKPPSGLLTHRWREQ